MTGGKRFTVPPLKWADVGLIALGVVALVVAVLALRSGTSTPASVAPITPATTGTPTTSATSTKTDTPATTTNTPTTTSTKTQQVVFLGDGFTAGSSGTSWASLVSDKLGWQATNLAVDGMGFLVAPKKCPQSPCTKFEGMIPKVAAESPSIVVVAVGTADGDQNIDSASSTFFKKLDAALPDARIIAVSPMWGSSTVPYWQKLHAASVKAAVTGVQGEYLDIGQPLAGKSTLVGESGLPSAEGQQLLATAVIEALQ